MKMFKTTRWVVLITGCLLVLLGVSMLFTPTSNLIGIANIIAIAMIVSGVSEIVSFFTSEKEERSGWVLTEGILWLLLGGWLLLGSGTAALAVIIPYIFSACVMATGVIRIVESFTLRSNGVSNWGWLLVAGILCVIFGAVMLVAPLLSVAVVSTLLALLVITTGVSNIMMFFTMKRLRDFIRRRRDRRG